MVPRTSSQPAEGAGESSHPSARRAALKPAIGAAILYAVIVVAVLSGTGRGPSSFVRFGQSSTTAALATEVLGGELVRRGRRHDGAYFWVHARDPLLIDADVYRDAVYEPGGRSARVLYPALVAPWRLGGEQALLWGMVLTNVRAGRRWAPTSRPGWPSTWVGRSPPASRSRLNPVVLFGTAMDLSDRRPVRVARRLRLGRPPRRWGPALVAAALVGAHQGVRHRRGGVRRRRSPSSCPCGSASRRRRWRRARFVLWSGYARWRLGWSTDRLQAFTPIPFEGRSTRRGSRGSRPGSGSTPPAAAGDGGAVRLDRDPVDPAPEPGHDRGRGRSALVLPFYNAAVYHLLYDSTRAVGRRSPSWPSSHGRAPPAIDRAGLGGRRRAGRAPRHLRNLLVVLSASTLPPVWQVGQ